MAALPRSVQTYESSDSGKLEASGRAVARERVPLAVQSPHGSVQHNTYSYTLGSSLESASTAAASSHLGISESAVCSGTPAGL